MKNAFLLRSFALASASVAAFALSTLIPATAQQSSTSAATQIKQIDTECSAIQNAVLALHPVHVAFVSSKWKVLNDADYTVAERTHKSITFADAWKQGKNYAWIQAHTFDAQGNQQATQLCFRQSDGTLERARQATTVPSLSSAAVQQAYYGSNGKVLQKSSAFAINDPMLAKKIASLPFFNVLP